MLKRLYATKVGTRAPISAVLINRLMKSVFDRPVKCIVDATDDNLIFFVICDASKYENFKKLCAKDHEWIEFDYFNLNKIEE